MSKLSSAKTNGQTEKHIRTNDEERRKIKYSCFSSLPLYIVAYEFIQELMYHQ